MVNKKGAGSFLNAAPYTYPPVRGDSTKLVAGWFPPGTPPASQFTQGMKDRYLDNQELQTINLSKIMDQSLNRPVTAGIAGKVAAVRLDFLFHFGH